MKKLPITLGPQTRTLFEAVSKAALWDELVSFLCDGIEDDATAAGILLERLTPTLMARGDRVPKVR